MGQEQEQGPDARNHQDLQRYKQLQHQASALAAAGINTIEFCMRIITPQESSMKHIGICQYPLYTLPVQSGSADLHFFLFVVQEISFPW